MTAVHERTTSVTAPQETRRPTTISLTPLENTQETLESWILWFNDPDIRMWMTHTLERTREDLQEKLDIVTSDPRRHYYTIMDNDRAIGLISLRQDQEPATTGEIGIAIGDKSLQSRGVGTAVLEAMLAYAKEDVGLTGIRALIKPANVKSVKLFTHHGFSPVGVASIDGEPFIRYEKQL